MIRRAVLFDLDGTLLDTLEDLADAVNAALADAGLPTHPLDAYRHFVGDGLENLIRRAMPADRVDDAALRARLMARQREVYGAHWAAKTRPYDGIPEMLATLAARGIPTGVLSNKPDDFTRTIVASFFPEHAFATVRGARPDTPIKPDPAGAFASAAALEVAPENVLYLGDTDTDMKTARAAGMVAVGACWGFRPAEELVEAGARTLLVRPDALPDVFDDAWKDPLDKWR